MDEKITNSIALHQATIEELKEVKRVISDGIDDTVKFQVISRRLVGYDVGIYRCKSKIDVSLNTMNMVIDELIEKEKERINKLIDMAIETRMNDLRIQD